MAKEVVNETVKILRAARDLISDPKKWTQGAYARDANGDLCRCEGPEAASWCAFGVLWGRQDATYYLVMCLPDSYKTVAAFNDCSTHEEVLALYARAIELALAEESG